MTKDNYLQIPRFIDFANSEFPGVYAVFFSVYKGKNPRFMFTPSDIETFFSRIVPVMNKKLKGESLKLFQETMDEKRRIIEGTRFPENISGGTCYLALSERVFTESGKIEGCSHLHRDGVSCKPGRIHENCSYGCNRRLVAFNEYVAERLKLLYDLKN